MFNLSKYLIGLDLYERHHIVSRILNRCGTETVVDVGGTAGTLQMFSKNLQILVVNIDDSGDLMCAGRSLPFADNSVDAVVSLDTLEHIPSQDRKHFVQEMLRVSGKDVVFCTPLGSNLHRRIEIELNEAWRLQFGGDFRFLREHIEFGLPTLLEIKGILEGWHYQLFFVGDVRLAAFLFRNHMRLLRSRIPLVWRLSRLLNFSSTFLFCFLRVSGEPTQFTNRVYAHIQIGKIETSNLEVTN